MCLSLCVNFYVSVCVYRFVNIDIHQTRVFFVCLYIHLLISIHLSMKEGNLKSRLINGKAYNVLYF